MADQSRLRNLENKRLKLVRRILFYRGYKEKTARFVQSLNSRYSQGSISHEEYYHRLNRTLKQRTPAQWIKYFDECIEYYTRHLNGCEKEIKREKNTVKAATSLVALALLIFLVAGLFFFKPSITGFAVYEPEGVISEGISFNVDAFIPASSIVELTLEEQAASLPITDFLDGPVSIARGNETIEGFNVASISISTGEFGILAPSEPGTYDLVLRIKDNGEVLAEHVIEITVEAGPQPEEAPAEAITDIRFGRQISCSTCGQHNAPPLTEVDMMITAEFVGVAHNDTLADYFEGGWIVADLNGGVVEEYDETHNKISWIVDGDSGIVSRSYTLISPDSASVYSFKSELSGVKSDAFEINVSDVPLEIQATEPEENITEPIEPLPEENITTPENVSGEMNITINITTIQHKAIIGKPVEWIKHVNLSEPGNAAINLPAEAENITVKKIIEDEEKIVNIPQPQAETTLTGRGVTGFVIQEHPEEEKTEIELNLTENATEYSIEYYTEAPQSTEQDISETRKIITISGPETLHYKNILAYTNINEIVKTGDESKINLYWLAQDNETNTTVKQKIDFIAKDSDNNGLIDYVEWNVPSLSSQTYELIIEISKAEHLDENYTFISDIYEQAYQLDNVWSEPIPSGHYIRVTFRQNLTSSNDITLYARNNDSSNTIIEVYYFNSSEKIAEFPIVTEEKYYKVYLTEMQGSYDTFDLRIKNLDDDSNAFLEFDHIIDPAIPQYTGGLLVYADGTAGTPKYKTFDDTDGFGIEQSATSVGASAIEWIRVAASPTNDEWIIATKDAADDIKVQVCTGTDTGVSCGSATTITTAGVADFRNYDVAYEQLSGDALLVYGTSTADILRKIEWTGGSWTNDAAITTTRTTGTVEWVELTSRPGSDQIGIAYSDSADDVSAYRWDGSAAADEATAVITAGATTGNCRKVDVSFEGSSGDMFVAAPLAAAGTIAYGALSGTTWTITTGTTPDVVTGCIDIQEPNPSDDDIGISTHGVAATTLSEGFEWSGTGITDGTAGDDNLQTWAANYQLTAINYMSSTYYAVAVISNSAATDDIDWWTMSSAGAITDQTVNTRTRGAARFIDLFDYPNADKVLLLTNDANSDLWADTWNGAATDASAWTDLTGGGALETALASATTDVVDFAFRLAPIPDTTAPSVTNTQVNDTSVGINELICINATAADLGVGVDKVWALITYPNGTAANTSFMSDTGNCAGSGGDNIYSVDVNVSSVAGNFYVNTTYANDTADNLGNQTPWPNLLVEVTIGASLAWNQSSLDIGTVISGNSAAENATASAIGSHTNVKVTSVSGNGTAFIAAAPADLGSMTDQSKEVRFNCSPSGQAEGYYEAVFNVNSTEYPQGGSITISCSVSYDDVVFNSSFEMGNLYNVTYQQGDSSGYRYYTAYVNYSTISFADKHWWFYYSIDNVAGKTIKVSLTNIAEVDITGDRWPNIEPFYSYDNYNAWYRFPLVDYSCCGIAGSRNFNITISPTQDKVWIAPVPPYPVSRRDELLNSYSSSPYLTVSSLGTLPLGQELTVATITDSSYEDSKKFKIYIIAQQHPAETGSWVAEGLIKFLLNESNSTAAQIRKSYIFRIIPIHNPEGVYYGISRYTPFRSGVQYDLNREWNDTILDVTKIPEVNWTFGDIQAWNPDVFVDMHSTINNNSVGQPHNSLHYYMPVTSPTSIMIGFMNNVSGGRNYDQDLWPETNNVVATGYGRRKGTSLGSNVVVYEKLGVGPSFMMEHGHDSILNSTSPAGLHIFTHNPQNISDWEDWGKRIGLGIREYYGEVFPNVALNSPQNNTSPSSNPITFNCSAEIYYRADLANITLYGNWSTGWHANETKTASGPSDTATFSVSVAPSGSYSWNCYACTASNNCSFASANYTFDISAQENQPPTIDDISDIPSQSITESSVSNVTFYVIVSDPDTTSDISAVNATFTKTGESTRFNRNCVKIGDLSSTQANYSCTIGIWYWDGAGTWDVNASAKDLSEAQSAPYSETFTLQETTAIVMAPTALAWGQLFLGSTDQLSTNDPIMINNTGNDDIDSGNVRVKAYSLVGETNPDYIMPAANFTVNINDACEGSKMQNDTAVGIAGSILPAGNNSNGEGQEELYFCLEQVPADIMQQTYSTALSWVVDVT